MKKLVVGMMLLAVAGQHVDAASRRAHVINKMGLAVAKHSVDVANTMNIIEFTHSKNPGKDIELGKLALYFAEKPAIQEHKHDHKKEHHSKKKSMSFFIANTTLAGTTTEKMMTDLMKQNPSDAYTVTVAVHKQHGNLGIMCTISYDPQTILIRRSSGEVQAQGEWQYAEVFTFHNKEMLEKLRRKQLDVVQTAWSDVGGLYALA